MKGEDYGAKPGHANHEARLCLIGIRTSGRVPGIPDRGRERYHSPDRLLLRRRDWQHGGRLRCRRRCRDVYRPQVGQGRHDG